MHKNIGYHTRLRSDGTKLTGGSFGGQIDQETIERLTRLFSVVVKPSGSPVFVDDKGREVNLYISVDPDKTIKGQEALKADRLRKEKEWEEEKALIEQQEKEIEEALQGLSHSEIIRRLKGK